MNACMAAHATAEEHDRAREDWFAARVARQRDRDRRELRRLEQERFHREWWRLPPDEGGGASGGANGDADGNGSGGEKTR